MDEVRLERRLTLIEERLTDGLDGVATEVRGMKEQVARQNGRVGKLEEFRAATEKAAAYAKGVAEGRSSLSKGQLAILAIVGPIVFAGADFALRLFA